MLGIGALHHGRLHEVAHAVVALNHPNIITVYEVGESANGHFIAMELIEGETLRQIERERVKADAREAVATAIYDHYKPVSMEDSVPRTVEGAVLSITDKADSIAGMFALGLQPTGSKDPFALRRQANGIVNNADPDVPDIVSSLQAVEASQRDQINDSLATAHRAGLAAAPRGGLRRGRRAWKALTKAVAVTLLQGLIAKQEPVP